MKRYLGLDLGTKSCGVSIADPTNTVILPYKAIHFAREDYQDAFRQIKEIIEKEGITNIAIGLPINMDGTLGFATERTMNFIPLLEEIGMEVDTVDERLTSVEAERLLHDSGLKSKEFKDRVDIEAAMLILESHLRSIS